MEENQLRDRLLLDKACTGDEEAKAELIDKYLPMVRHIVKNQPIRWQESEDMCQEGIIGLLKAIDEYAPERFTIKFSTFAYICILRRVTNTIKQTYAKKTRVLTDAVSLYTPMNGEETRILMDSLVANGGDPLDDFLQSWSEEKLHVVLKSHLSQVEYAVMDLFLQGFSAGEIQDKLGLEPKVVDNARTRARLKLRHLIEKFGSLLHPDLPLNVRKRLDLAMRVKVG